MIPREADRVPRVLHVPALRESLETATNFATYKQWNEKLPMPPSWNTSMLSTGVKNLPEEARIACRKPELLPLFRR
ncbi:MAG: hypothetical protein ACLU4N_16500 [Butyricimonas faecihominis]